jgi:conserved oligomeric Golgi complex subunit 6
MADMNELLSRAALEAEAVAFQASQAAEGAERLLEQATSLGERVEAEHEEARRRLADLERQLRDGQLVRPETAAALAALRSGQARDAALRAQAEEFLGRLHAELALLRGEKERVLGELEPRAQAAEADVAAYADRVRQLEAATEARLEAARAAMGALREQAAAARTTLRDRRSLLLAELRVSEESVRERLDALLKTFEALGLGLQEQARDLAGALHSLSERAAGGLKERFAREALVRLAESAEGLKEGMKAAEEFAQEQERRLDKTFEMLADLMKATHDSQGTVIRNLR